jgi:glycosyltransferase involved in cell wall biosynthesis
MTGSDFAGDKCPSIDVVIPVFNKVKFLSDAVGSVVPAAELYGSARVWLVDNGSTDGSYEVLTKQFGNRAHVLRLIPGTIAAVRNFGAKHGTAPVISFIDSDCVVPLDYFDRLAAVLAETGAEATGCTVVLPQKPTWVEAVWSRLHDDGREGDRTWINSANFAVRRATFEEIGGFNESCETDEDTEICFRIRAGGGRLVSDPRLEAAHLDNAKTLLAFFRKERWRGLGMFSTASYEFIDKVTAMMILHLISLIVAIVSLAFVPAPLWARVGLASGLALFVPSATVGYRRRSSVAQFNPLLAVVLYEFFYAARINALFVIGLSRIRRARVTSRAPA